jgi:serine/threonine-protein kinase
MHPFTDLEANLPDRFRLVRELGSGGMGVVFVAEDLRHQREVALKVLRPELAQSLGRARFLREILIAARLNHPNILPLLDSGEAGEYLYYVMPYVEGESLRDRLARETQLPVDEALRITGEIADALDYAHQQGVIHRDIKPENILMVAGHPVVTDFGIARALSEAGGSRLTATGIPVGTPLYMSPEQATGDGEVDERADVYALATILYELLSGITPYTGATPQSVLARKLVDPVPSLRVVRDAVPPALESVIERGLAKVPADRFPTVRAFAEALASGEAPESVPRPGSQRGRRWLVVAGGALVLLCVGWILYSWLPGATGGPASLRTSFQPLTAEPGVEWFPSISPDGGWLAYSGLGAGKRDIFLRSVGGENSLNLTADLSGDHDQPVFSPDGERIAFRSEADGGGIFVMARTGESVRRITREGFNPTWSPDGTRLAYSMERVENKPQNSDGRGQLRIVEVATGEARSLEIAGDAVLPSWSPNGHRIAYFSQSLGGSWQYWGIWTVDPEGGDPVPVSDGTSLDWNPAWAGDGRHLYFSSDRGGSMNLWRVAVDERTGHVLGPPEPVTTPATSLAHISVSADGRRLVYSNVLETQNLQRMAMDPGSGVPLGEPEWVTSGTRRWSSPDPSPDGQTVAMYSLTQPDGALFIINADGTGLRRVTADSAVDRVPRWSPDGQWLAFFSQRGQRIQPWRIRRDGSDLVRMGPRGSVAVWSPEGDRMAVAGGAPRATLIVDPWRPWDEQVPDTLRRHDSTDAVVTPNDWSQDGAWLAGSPGFDDDGVGVLSVAEGSTYALTDFGQWPVWFPNSRTILFVTEGNAYYVVDRVTRETRRVFSVERDVIGPPRLTRDGRVAFFTRRVIEADIWMVTLH